MSTISRAKRTQKAKDARNPALFAGVQGEYIGADEVVQMPKTIKSWRSELDQAIADDVSGARRLRDVVIQARTEGYDVDTVREHVADAFQAAGCSEATCRQRAADAAVIVDYPEKAFLDVLGSGGFGSVQTFAAQLRKVAKLMGLVTGRQRKAKTPDGDGQEGTQDAQGEPIDESRTQVADDQGIAALATTRRALEQLANRAGTNALALDIIANIRDLLDDVADALIGVEVVDAEVKSA